jgi:uncharacterized repeat protein (TIGR02543 family)
LIGKNSYARAASAVSVSTADQLNTAITGAQSGDDIIINIAANIDLDREFICTQGANYVLQSDSATPRKLTRTVNGNIFTYNGSGAAEYTITFNNLILDGAMDQGLYGNMITINNKIALNLGEAGGSAVIQNCKPAELSSSIIYSETYCVINMYNNSVIRDCTIVTDPSASTIPQLCHLVLARSHCQFNMYDYSSIHNTTNVVQSLSSPIIYVPVASVFSMSGHASLHDNIASGFINTDEGEFILADDAEIRDNIIHGIVASLDARSPASARFRMSGGKIVYNHGVGTGQVCIGIHSHSTADITGGEISYNNSPNGHSGIWVNAPTASATISGGTFKHNTSGLDGGAFFCGVPNVPIGVSNCSFIGNQAPNGGAIYVPDYNTLTLGPNVRFENNRADRYYHNDSYTPVVRAGTRALSYDPAGVTCTAPFLNPFNNADVSADGTDPLSEIAPFIQFNLEGGKGNLAEQIVMPSQLASEPPNPTKSGYAFTGWYTSQTGGVKWDFNTMIPSEHLAVERAGQYGIVLYAHWKNVLSQKELCRLRWRKGRAR